MAGGSSATNARRAGKYNKPTRGGGKHYSRTLQPTDADGNHVSIWSAERSNSNDSDDPGQGSEEAESSNEDDHKAGLSKTPELGTGREDRRAQKKARKEAALAKQNARTVEVGDMPSSDDDSDDEMPANPNHSKSARKMAQGDNGVKEITEGVKSMKVPASRREREAMEATAAKEQYMKLQAQGKTDEAKADLARLRLIREQRDAEAARRQAEKEEKEEQDKSRKPEFEAREARRREAAAAPKKGGRK